MAQRQTIQVIAHSFVTLFGEDALETSVPWVLDAYGYLDMNDYAQQDTADTTAVEPASTADASSADYIFPSDRQYITEDDMAGWNQKTALLARNEIYARHGYVFQDAGNPELLCG